MKEPKLSEYDKGLETYYIGYHSRDDEVKSLKDERDNLLISNERIGLMYGVEDYKKLEVEIVTLREQVQKYRMGEQNIEIACIYWKKRAESAESRLSKAQDWKDNQLERLKDFFDTTQEYKGSQEYYYLKELEEALDVSASCTKGEVKE